MQVDSIGSDDVEAGKAIKRAMNFLAAVAVAAAAGLATIDVPEAVLTPQGLKTDASEYGVPPSSTTGTSATPAMARPEAEVRRTDRANDAYLTADR